MNQNTYILKDIIRRYFSRNQSNFHVFYYLYDGFETSGKLKEYSLPSGRKLRYLRITDKGVEKKRAFKMRNNPHNNAAKFKELTEHLKFLDMEEHCEIIWRILAAILMIGEIRFVEGNNGEAELDSNEAANRGKLRSRKIQYVEFKCKYVEIIVYKIP